MKYAVHWSRRALNVVTRDWLAADSEQRSAISHTIAAIDEMLETAPAECGESRDEGRRVLFAAPFVVTFLVIEAQHVAIVLNVRRM